MKIFEIIIQKSSIAQVGTLSLSDTEKTLFNAPIFW